MSSVGESVVNVFVSSSSNEEAAIEEEEAANHQMIEPQRLRLCARPRVYGTSGDFQSGMLSRHKQQHEGARIRERSPTGNRLWRFEKKKLRFWKRQQLDANSFSSVVFASRETNYMAPARAPFFQCFDDEVGIGDVDMSLFTSRCQLRAYFWNLIQTNVDIHSFVYFTSWNLTAFDGDIPRFAYDANNNDMVAYVIESISSIIEETHPCAQKDTQQNNDKNVENADFTDNDHCTTKEDFSSFSPYELHFTQEPNSVGVHITCPDEERALADERLRLRQDLFCLLHKCTPLVSDLFSLVHQYLIPTCDEEYEKKKTASSAADASRLNARQVCVVACMYSSALQELLPLFTFTATAEPHTPTNSLAPFLRQKMQNKLLDQKRTTAKHNQRKEKIQTQLIDDTIFDR